jgi:MSHA biogenesis protein MshO
MTRRSVPAVPRQRGFSLVELIVVIVVLGVLAGSVAVFINNPVRAYFDTVRRAALADAADTALRRLVRDLQGALPNSVRVATSGGAVFIEFIPVEAAGRYRSAVSGGNETAGTNPLDFAATTDTSFQVLGPPVTVPASNGINPAQLVIFNLGASGFDAYAGSNRRSVTTAAGSTQTISFAAAGTWPAESPAHRFFLVSGPVSYVCTPVAGGGGRIERFSAYAFSASQPVSTSSGVLAAATRTVLVDLVAGCSAALTSPLANASGVALTLQLAEGSDGVSLQAQVHLPNTP